MRVLLLLFLVAALLPGCAADDAGEEEPALEGPALVVWYTDN
jgi:hypothetical protein